MLSYCPNCGADGQPCATNCPTRVPQIKPRDTEPNCPSRRRPLPCIESIERPGRCVHCQQAIERAAGAPHGPYCTGDSRCRECARLQREARAETFPDAPTPTPPPAAAAELPAALLEEWRSDADRWARFGVMPADETRLATQRIATLIAALLDARAGGELSAALLDKAAELEKRLEAIRAELWQLGMPRRTFSSTPVEIISEPDPICSIRSEAVGSPVPCFASHAHPSHVARCTFCDRAMLPPR